MNEVFAEKAAQPERANAGLRKPVDILIPAYGAAEHLSRCLRSLLEHAPQGCRIYVLDDGTPDDSVRGAVDDLDPQVPGGLGYIRREPNGGFVRTCNWGVANLRKRGSDLLLLNSDTEVTAGFLQEMQEVLYLHEKHAVVTPRSNHATIFSLPAESAGFRPEQSYDVWLRMRSLLPRYHVAPTAVGFCILVKDEVLDRFEFFDEAYGPGYNEENDFICRINAYGYSAVSANHAFVYHYETSSFGPRRIQLEETNRKLLISRYPEYPRKVSDYVKFFADPLERFAPLYIAHKPRILYDLFHLRPQYNGTAEFGLALLRDLQNVIGDEFELHVGVGEGARDFFDSDVRGYLVFEDAEDREDVFDVVFKPSQVFNWGDFQRMNRYGARMAYTLQDIIIVRCEYLNSARRQILFSKAADFADHVFSISEQTAEDFRSFYRSAVPMQVIHHGTDFMLEPGEQGRDQYVLLVGNPYRHKALEETVAALGGEWPIVVLGGKESEREQPTNVRRIQSGELSKREMRQLYLNAQALVYPSHYEGFGLPVLDALALGKPVVVLDTEVNRELGRLTGMDQLSLVRSTREVAEAVRAALGNSSEGEQRAPVRRWRDAAEEYAAAFREIIARPIDVEKLRDRWAFVRALETVRAKPDSDLASTSDEA